jgi:hypothetical protein
LQGVDILTIPTSAESLYQKYGCDEALSEKLCCEALVAEESLFCSDHVKICN